MSESQEFPKFHVVFIATSTDEKVRDLNLIAEKKLLPLKFFNLDRLAGTLHNTTEDGRSAEENASKKLLGIQAKIEQFRNDKTAVHEFCEAQGIPNIDMHRVWFGTEDAGVTMPEEIWKNIPSHVLDVLPDDVKARLAPLESGPAVDTAPFLSATLGGKNIEYIINAGLNAYAEKEKYFIDQKSLIFKEESVLKLQPMIPQFEIQNDGKRTEVALESKGITHNYLANQTYTPTNEDFARISNYHSLSPAKRARYSSTTAAELGLHYIANYSARSEAVSNLVRKINQSVTDEHILKPVAEANKNKLIVGIAKEPAVFHVGVVNADLEYTNAEVRAKLAYEGKHLHLTEIPSDEMPPKNASDVQKARFYLSAPERMLEKSDGLILLPDSARSDGKPMSLEEKIYMLSSIAAAKQLIHRDKDKQLVIINTDHSWDKALSIHKHLSDFQMTKNHTIPLGHKLPKVTITPDAYFHVINGGGTTYAEALEAAAYLMKDASLTYHRVPHIKTNVESVGKDAPYKQQSGKQYPKNQVAIFCSASSENTPLNRYVSNLAERLVASGKRIICGGGDRYTMGAILDGVKKHRATALRSLDTSAQLTKSYIAGISTLPIVAAETNEGEMPDSYSYRELAEDIYDRMAKIMVGAETAVVAPGGAGTMQEWMGFHLLKQKMPELFASKKLVIFDPELMQKPEQQDSKKSTIALKNKVFDDILKIVLGDGLNQYRLQWSRENTRIAANVDEVMQACGVESPVTQR